MVCCLITLEERGEIDLVVLVGRNERPIDTVMLLLEDVHRVRAHLGMALFLNGQIC